MVVSDELVTLDYARKQLIPRRSDGKPVNPSTVWRWIRKGLEGLDGIASSWPLPMQAAAPASQLKLLTNSSPL